MKKMVLLSIIMLVVVPMPMLAKYDAYIDGIFYKLNIIDKTASVTYDSYKYSGVVNIPNYITYNNITYSVTSIGYLAFNSCVDLTYVTIPNSVTEIAACAFENCTKLTSIKIPKSVKIIDGHAFTNTGWYNNQPNGLLYLDSCLVGLKGSVAEEVIIKEGTRLIAGSTFGNCQNLAFINIPQSVTSIGSAAFMNCSSLVIQVSQVPNLPVLIDRFQ